MGSAVTLLLGTRGSRLARRQSQWVADQLRAAHPNLRIETIIIKTTGDQITDRPLYEEGGKGLFIRELELALIEKKIDLAVHSCKDLPVTMPLVDSENLIIAATPARHDARDALLARDAATIAQLPQSARVATGSLRRRCQLLARRPDLQIVPMRGNIDTRLKKLDAGECDAMVLAVAGLARAGLWEDWMYPVDPGDLLPAPGQGALALQCRRDDAQTVALVAPLEDYRTRQCVEMERAIVAGLRGDCHSPIAALAEIIGKDLRLRCVVGGRDGAPTILSAAVQIPIEPIEKVKQAVSELLRDLIARGALDLLAGV
jgi:hydroxymethylbilane synthase